jgi:23S rRNA pseudouridine1911/1915/1917 synthase
MGILAAKRFSAAGFGFGLQSGALSQNYPPTLMPPAPQKFQFVADRGDAGRRLDQSIVRRVTGLSKLSRTEAQRWIVGGAVEVDGRTASRPSTSLREGATVTILVPASAPRRATPAAEQAPLDILHEDADVIVINKPAGVVVHPTYKQTAGTVLNALLWHVRSRRGVKPGILTRLDKDTSGLVAVALSPGAHAAVQRDGAAGRVRKEYLAVATATPSPRRGRITLPLARDPADRRRVVPSSDGAPSETRYEVLAASDRASLVRCELVTGRTHQIRVHLSARGWPIAGDRLYGGDTTHIGRQALHAWRLTLPHPVSGAPLSIEAPLPDDMAALMAASGIESPFRAG